MTDKWMDNGRRDAQKNNAALAHLYHEGKRCSKFGRIPPSGLGGDSVTEGWNDGRMEALTISPSLF